MRKVLIILSELSDGDLDWMISAGSRQSLEPNGLLIQEGRPVDALCLVLEGRFLVTAGSQTVAELGVGEAVGEISFLDERPPTASVRAMVPSRVLRIPGEAMRAHLKQDVGFAARFYRALALFLADRLRASLSRNTYSGSESLGAAEFGEEINPALLDGMAVGGARFEWVLQRLRGG